MATNGKDCTGPFTSLGHNLIGNNQGCTFNATTGDLVGTNENPIDPRLSPLQDYGGRTLTHALRTGSLAIDAGNPAVPGSGGNACPSTDQRGITRPQGSHCDIGAYEAETGGTLPAAPSFADVPMTHPYWQEIEILYANGLTGGCGTAPLRFCPDKTMNRGEAAVFILRGTFGSGYLPAPATHIFKDDWRKGRWAEPWAEAMRNTGLSAGCLTSPLKYCPWNQIPREQAVIFALRLRYGVGYQPPAATGTVFADMTNPNYFATAWAEQAYKDGLIQQCGVSSGRPKFCPKNIVSRGLAAQLIVRAKNLTMP